MRLAANKCVLHRMVLACRVALRATRRALVVLARSTSVATDSALDLNALALNPLDHCTEPATINSFEAKDYRMRSTSILE
jgi:hypothetical protein